jgi:hypothetical protein
MSSASSASAPAENKPFPNQIKAAQSIVSYYMAGFMYCLLKACEQAGKTGTYHSVITYMFDRNMIDNVYIICGSSEIELLNQCIDDIEEWHSTAIYRDSIHYPIFRQHFDNSTMITRRSLIIVDETHLVQNTKQTLNKFLNKHRLDMSGRTPFMVENEVYILSVDATPYAEESAIHYKMCNEKKVVELENGDKYYGVKQYFENNKIDKTYNVEEKEGEQKFRQLLQSQNKKFSLLRLQERNKQTEKIIQIAREENYNILYFDSKHMNKDVDICITKKDAYDHYRKYGKRVSSLEEQPTKNTLVIVDGRLRCGKRLPKKHIGFVWEGMKQSKTDTIRQGLIGRMCGYIGDRLYDVPTVNNIRVFLPENILATQEDLGYPNKVINMCEIARSSYQKECNVAPRFASNLIPGKIQNKAERDEKTVHQCVPIRFNLSEEQTEELKRNPDTNIDTVKGWALAGLVDNTMLIIDNLNLTPSQQDEIINWISRNNAGDCNLRRYKGTSNQNMHKCHVEAYENQCCSNEHTQMDPLTFCVVYPEFTQHESINTPCIAGQVYAIFYTEAEGHAYTINMQSRIAKVNDKTHFTFQITPEIETCVAGGIYGFTPAIKTNPNELLKQMDAFIDFSKQRIGIVSKTFTSLRNGEYITLPKAVYGNGLERMKEVFRLLEAKHRTNITYEVSNIERSGTDIELTFISWE